MKSLNKITRQFERIVAQLECLAEQNQAKQKENAEKISKISQENRELHVERSRAIEIRNNVNRLLGKK